MKHVPKKWGEEIWIVNNDEYCAKFLHIKAGAISSYHYHPKKKETFYCLRGRVILMIFHNAFDLRPESEPITINPCDRHNFTATEDSTILEISTHHEDDDCIRLIESRSA